MVPNKVWCFLSLSLFFLISPCLANPGSGNSEKTPTNNSMRDLGINVLQLLIKGEDKNVIYEKLKKTGFNQTEIEQAVKNIEPLLNQLEKQLHEQEKLKIKLGIMFLVAELFREFKNGKLPEEVFKEFQDKEISELFSKDDIDKNDIDYFKQVFDDVLPKNQQTPATQEKKEGQETEYAFIKNPRVTLKDIVGKYPEGLEILIAMLRNPQLYPGDPVKALLFYGPPGTGKTLYAEVIANMIGAVFATISAPEFLDKYVGEGARKLRELFEKCEEYGKKYKQKVIVFIDEFDAIAGSRDTDSTVEKVHRDLVNQLLSLLNKEYEYLVFVVATNSNDHLDNALTRSGRITHHIKFENPDKISRLEVIEFYVKKFFNNRGIKINISDQEVRKLANLTEGLSQADLRQIVSDAGAQATFKGKITNYIFFRDAVRRIFIKKMDEEFDKLKKTTAKNNTAPAV